MHPPINKKKIYLYFLIFIFLPTTIITNYSMTISKYFNVKSIDIIGLNFELQNELKQNLNTLKNKNIFLIKNDDLLNILQKYNEFEDYKVHKIFPYKIKIEIRKTNYIAKTLINGKEFLIGILNGIIFAIISAVVVHIWFNDLTLSLIISISMVLNMIVAGLFGILVPITLKKFNIDPAIASSVFVTTITDVIGFLSFLGVGAFFFYN